MKKSTLEKILIILQEFICKINDVSGTTNEVICCDNDISKTYSNFISIIINLLNFVFYAFVYIFRISEGDYSKRKANHNAFDNFKALCNEKKLPCKYIFIF